MRRPAGNSIHWAKCGKAPEKGGNEIRRPSRFRRAFRLALGTVACAVTLLAVEEPPAVEPVGALGREECLIIEGGQTFSGAGIVNALRARLEFYARSAPAAPLADYLAWLGRTVQLGYQRSGFARAVVTVKVDQPSQRIRVNVVEGLRYRCGAIKITGLDPVLTDQLDRRLQEVAALSEPVAGTGQPAFAWPWRESDQAPADAASLAVFERSAVVALSELNRYQAEVQVVLSLDDNRRQADLLIQVRKPGVAGILDQIEVEGLRVNSREDLLSFLQLRPGMPMTGNVTNDVIQRLWSSGRFSGHLAQLSPMAEAGRFKLALTVVEFTNAPALKRELTAEERGFLKLREWMLDWRKRAEDWVFKLEGARKEGRFSGEVVLGQEGLAILIRQPSTEADPPPLGYGFIAAPEHIGFYSGLQQSKLVRKPKGGQIETVLALAGNPDHDNARGWFSAGAFWRSGSDDAPFSLRLDLAPVAFVAFAHPLEGACRIEQGLLTLRDDDLGCELTADAATGRLVSWRTASSTNDFRFVIQSEEGALARVLREVAAAGASFTNVLDAQHPWSSSLAVLGRDLAPILETAFPKVIEQLSAKLGGAASTRELLATVKLIEELPWSDLLAPLDLFSSTTAEADGSEDFPFILETPLPSVGAGGDWVRMFGGLLLRANDDFWPRGSWPWAILQNATFLAAGETRQATDDIARLTQAPGTGPLGCLIAAHVLGRFDPQPAIAFSLQGAGRAAATAFQEDVRLLLRGEEAGPKFLRGVLQRGCALREQELHILMRLFGTNALPIVLECCASLRANSGIPPDEALRPVLERHWEKEIRPHLLTEFAKVCLGGEQKLAMRPDSAPATAAAGWLRDAADQGFAQAQMLLGQLYANGLGVTANPETAATWMRKAEEQGYPHAACELGRLYGAMGNRREAIRWLRRGAKDGCSSGEIGLAGALLSGPGVTPEEQEEAMAALRKAAERGAPQAHLALGNLYEQRGRIEEALDAYREAARKGLTPAQTKLGDLLSDGVSTKPEYVEAWIWLNLAAAHGDRLAAVQARSVERKLTPQQLAEAKVRLGQTEESLSKAGFGDPKR